MLHIFNNIIAPVVATAFIDTNCFYYVLHSQNEIHTSFSFPSCVQYIFLTGTCDQLSPITLNTSFQAAYTYNYLCTSDLLATFADVWVYMFLFDMINQFIQLLVLNIDSIPYLYQSRLWQYVEPRLVPLQYRNISQVKK